MMPYSLFVEKDSRLGHPPLVVYGQFKAISGLLWIGVSDRSLCQSISLP